MAKAIRRLWTRNDIGLVLLAGPFLLALLLHAVARYAA